MSAPRRMAGVVALCLVSSACAHLWGSKHAKQDFTVRIPAFFGGDPGRVALSGEELRAIEVAADDFLPAQWPTPPCEARRETQRFEVIRQGELIFVRISSRPDACPSSPALDGAVRYAISVDGRILRRLLDGESSATLLPDGGWDDGTPSQDGGLTDAGAGDLLRHFPQ